jgi:Fe-S-cluster containining protein
VSGVRVLSFHASYRCRQTGRCCASGWPIPVEVTRLTALRAAVAHGRLAPRGPGKAFDAPDTAPPEEPATLARPDGLCTFFDGDGRPGCRIHASLGHDALPLACRQFPRITVRDPRGASVTLSHYCPTAASLLDSESAVAIVTGGKGFPAAGEYIGLDASRALPPLLRPDMATDWKSWWDLERRAVDLIGTGAGPLDEDLARLRQAVEHVRAWSPGTRSLRETIAGAFDRDARSESRLDARAALAAVRRAIPAALRASAPARPEPPRPMRATALRRFVAAHAFANWMAYLAMDLRIWMASIDAAYLLARHGFPAGEVDLLIRHLADPRELARELGASTTAGVPSGPRV